MPAVDRPSDQSVASSAFPFETQATGWKTLANDVLDLSDALNPATLLPGQSGGKIDEAADAISVFRTGAAQLADTASETAQACSDQSQYDRSLASNPVTEQRVADARQFAADMRVMMRRGDVSPEQVDTAEATADDLASQRKDAITRHETETMSTRFPDVPTLKNPDLDNPDDPSKHEDTPSIPCYVGAKGTDPSSVGCPITTTDVQYFHEGKLFNENLSTGTITNLTDQPGSSATDCTRENRDDCPPNSTAWTYKDADGSYVWEYIDDNGNRVVNKHPIGSVLLP